MVAANGDGWAVWAVVVGGAVGGAAGVLGGWLSAHLTTRSAERVAHSNRRHEREMAAIARNQERWAPVYVDLVDFLNRWCAVAHLAATRFAEDPPATPPPFPEEDEQWRLQALVDAYASDAVRELMSQWLAKRRDVERVSQSLKVAQNATLPQNITQLRTEINEASSDLDAATERVKAAARHNLRGGTRGNRQPPSQ